jgi:hypothetical protein
MKNLSREQMMESLGTVGEKLVANYLSKNHQVEISPFKFDKEKDMLVDGMKVEVKTQAPLFKMNCFTIQPNQLYKCKNSQVLMFVSAPHPNPKLRHKTAGWIYQILNGEFEYKSWKDSSGEPRILIPIDQKAVIPLVKVTDEEAFELQRYVYTKF